MGIKQFAQFCKDQTFRDVRVLKDIEGSLWVKFDHSGRLRTHWFEDTPDNRRVLESLERDCSTAQVFPFRRRALA